MSEKGNNQNQEKKVDNHSKTKKLNDSLESNRAFGPQLEEKEYSQHVYDINLTELYFNFQNRFSNNPTYLKGFECFLKAVIKHFDITFEDITVKKNPFIVRPLDYHYSASLAYQLIIMDRYKIPLFLNYHYARFPPPNQIDFVHILEYYVYELITNNSPKEINSSKIRKTLSKWVEKKQNSYDDYFTNGIRENEKESVLEIFFLYYAETKVKDEDCSFLETDDNTLKELIYRFINFNSSEFDKMYNKEQVKCRWNGSVITLVYLIYFLIKIKKNGYRLYTHINIQHFIELTFRDKNNKRIGEETITRYLNRIEKEDLSKPVQKQNEMLCEIWERIHTPKNVI